ncbi:MAG: hypothetical protein ACRCW2_09800 [Cellulosilyticaceae bacterium]
MRNLSRLIVLASVLFVLAWVVYGRTLAVWYAQQTLAVEQSLATAQMEVAQLEGHLTRLDRLEAEVADLGMLVAGIQRQLPPREDRMALWTRLEDFARGYDVTAVTMGWLGETIDEATQLGVSHVALSYSSSYEESMRLLGGLREQRHFHEIETLDMEYGDEAKADQSVRTTVELGVYYDPRHLPNPVTQDLLGLVGASETHVEEAPMGDQALWQVRHLGVIDDRNRYEVTGNDRQGKPYVITVASQAPPQVSQTRMGASWYLVVETLEGEQVQQWLGE